MAVSVMRQETDPALFGAAAKGGSLETFPVGEGHLAEVMRFLAERPVHTVYMASLLRDNGITNPLHRGKFYGCRDEAGTLLGVALIGHATLVEARSEAAVAAFAQLARRISPYLIRGEQAVVETFWKYYAGVGANARLIAREMLYEQRTPVSGRESVPALRQATLADLAQVMEVNASMAVAESGVNPMERDPVGFRIRTARRIEQGRIWVWREGDRLLFKADVLAETPEAVYLEGVHVHEDSRGKGIGLRCMSQLGITLLQRIEAICLVVNEQSEAAQAFYRKSGYHFVGYYDTIYLQVGGGGD